MPVYLLHLFSTRAPSPLTIAISIPDAAVDTTTICESTSSAAVTSGRNVAAVATSILEKRGALRSHVPKTSKNKHKHTQDAMSGVCVRLCGRHICPPVIH